MARPDIAGWAKAGVKNLEKDQDRLAAEGDANIPFERA
jgi:hypothetical protein